MSDNIMSTAASSPALSAQQTPAAEPLHDFASDTEMVLAAIGRMEAAVRGERATHERLRAELTSMADAIAHVKTSLRNAASSGKPVNVLVLLTWLEARVHGMREYLGPAKAAVAELAAAVAPDVATAEPEAVPTVSDVVSRLGRASDAIEKEAQALEQSAPAAADDVPTVSMLGAMVEALTAPEPTEAKVEAEVPAQAELLAEQAEAEPEAAVFDVAPETEVAEATAAEANVPETLIAEIVADDPAPDVTAFAGDLGAVEASAPEPEAAATDETGPAELEALVAERGIADEPALETVSEPVTLEADPSVDAAALVFEPKEAETAATGGGLAEPEAVADETTEAAPTEATATETVAVAEATAVSTSAHEPSAHEFELLTRFAAMEAIPFMRDEIGTAVIFEPKTEFDPAAEQTAFATPAQQVELAPEPVQTTAQLDTVAEEPQAETVSLVQPELETAKCATVEVEPADHIERELESVLQDHPTMAVSAQEPQGAEPPSKFAAYAGASTLAFGAINATAVLADASKPEMTAGAVETAALVEAVEPDSIAEETAPEIEFFTVDEPEAEAVATPEAAIDVVVEPALVEAGELTAWFESTEAIASEGVIVTPEPEAAPLEAANVEAETAAAAVVVLETVGPEAKIENAQAPAGSPATDPAVEAAAATIEAETAITGPSEAERTAFAQALAEMAAAAAAAEPEATSVATPEAPAEQPPRAHAEADAPVPLTETSDAPDDDLSDLFEPEPDAALDPNAVLLGPAPAFMLHPATAAVLPMHDMALPQVAKPAETAQPEVVEAPVPAKLHDPLAPLKAMSDEEKIALFS